MRFTYRVSCITYTRYYYICLVSLFNRSFDCWKLWRECSLVEPLGTITKYYKFIDEETKTILDSLMDESSSYFDFVRRLCDVVLENEVPVNLAYIAAVQAWWYG